MEKLCLDALELRTASSNNSNQLRAMIMDPDAGSVDSEVGRVDCGKVSRRSYPCT